MSSAIMKEFGERKRKKSLVFSVLLRPLVGLLFKFRLVWSKTVQLVVLLELGRSEQSPVASDSTWHTLSRTVENL